MGNPSLRLSEVLYCLYIKRTQKSYSILKTCIRIDIDLIAKKVHAILYGIQTVSDLLHGLTRREYISRDSLLM